MSALIVPKIMNKFSYKLILILIVYNYLSSREIMYNNTKVEVITWKLEF